MVPTYWPPFAPPPAIHMVKPHGLWSRPLLCSLNGVRPNSPPQTTRVSFSMPRAFRSASRPAIGLSVDPHYFGVIAFEVVMRIPAAARAAVQFDETHSALHQLARHQAVRSEDGGGRVVHAVHLLGGFGLLRQIHRFGCGRLHLVGQLVGADPRVQFGVVRTCPPPRAGSSLQQPELAALLLVAHSGGRLQIEDRRIARAELRALVESPAGTPNSSSAPPPSGSRRPIELRKSADSCSRCPVRK